VRILKNYDKVSLMEHIEVQLKKDNINFLPYDTIKYVSLNR